MHSCSKALWTRKLCGEDRTPTKRSIMNPRLAAISGKLKGATFTFGDKTVIIGRDTNASICIADPSVSRRHSQIERDGNEFQINDLESLNGTFINDVPVKTRRLQHGDR